MGNVLCNNSSSIGLRKNVLQCYIEPILVYGSEACTFYTKARKKSRGHAGVVLSQDAENGMVS
jgi:hypothetical protein